MNLHITESIPDTLSTDLLDNVGCQTMLRQLNDFENLVFGPDFACDYATIQPWIDSGCLFYTAVCGEAVPGRRRILSLVSVFITTSASRDRMMAGEIADYELTPWTRGDHSAQPTIYFSAVVSDSPAHLAGMYASLLNDVKGFQDANGLNFHSGFAVSTGPAGFRHMARNGFRQWDSHKYRGIYDLLVIDASTAAAEFWRGLLNSETVFLRRAGANGTPEAAPDVIESSTGENRSSAPNCDQETRLRPPPAFDTQPKIL